MHGLRLEPVRGVNRQDREQEMNKEQELQLLEAKRAKSQRYDALRKFSDLLYPVNPHSSIAYVTGTGNPLQDLKLIDALKKADLKASKHLKEIAKQTQST